MTSPESTPPGGDDPGRGLSGVQRAGIVLGALAVLLIVFVVLQGGDDSGSDSSSSAPQTTATQTATTTTATESTSTGSTSTEDSTTGSTTDDNGSGGSGSDDDAESETGTTETQPSAPAVQTVRVVNGQPQGGVERLEYEKGDRVRLKVQSDVADEIHVHGYDLMKDVSAGGSVTFSFTADIEGRFEIELEDAGTQIAELEVKPA
jgi:cytoskeletal protein RodZ